MQDILCLLTRQFTALHVWLPRLQRDIMLAGNTLLPESHATCELVAFAAARPMPAALMNAWGTPGLLNSLASFMARGGELVGFIGNHLVGYVFAADKEVLVDEVCSPTPTPSPAPTTSSHGNPVPPPPPHCGLRAQRLHPSPNGRSARRSFFTKPPPPPPAPAPS